tara:strand:+ start:284 stop:985 length:702 start_codon:yes stop_codon:yes gene_type:complete
MKNIGLILAAGKGTRYKGKKKKIFLKIKKRTLINYAINKFKRLGLEINIIINKEDRNKFFKNDYKFIYQNKSLGTGHAIKVFLKKKPKFKKCLIINADTPFIHFHDLKRTMNEIKYHNLCILSYVEKENHSNGVFIEVKKNKYIIKEFELLNNEEKKNYMCNSGLIAFDNKISKEFFNIKKNLKKREYLITDILKIVLNKKYKTNVIKAKFPKLCRGINTISDFERFKKNLNN